MRTSYGWCLACWCLAAVGCSQNPDAEGRGPDKRSLAGAIPSQGSPFVERAADSGLTFQHLNGAAGAYHLPEIMGAGVALLDFDGDGDLDVYLVQSGSLTGDANVQEWLIPPPVEVPPLNQNFLFKNLLVEQGRLGFSEVDEAAGAGDTGYGMGAAVADVDHDGDPDLLATNLGENRIYLNGGGVFSGHPLDKKTIAEWSTSAAFCDIDGDGHLDLYVANYVEFSLTKQRLCRGPTGRDYCSPVAFAAVPDRLYRNLGNGEFVDIGLAAGISAVAYPGLGVVCADFDADGDADFYVANDRTENLLWINQGDGRFENAGPLSGAAVNAGGVMEASMGIAVGDMDGDGDEDLFVTHYDPETNTLYVNKGNGLFIDATDRFGLGVPSFSYTGWGTAWLDTEQDGDLDLFVVNGAILEMAARVGISVYPYQQSNQWFENLGDGFAAAVIPGEPRVGRGAAFGDLDQDGDTDVVVNNNNGPAGLWLNESKHKNHWLAVRLHPSRDGAGAVGARVALLRPGQPPVWRRSHRDGSYLSSGDGAVDFGLGKDSEVLGIGVLWPDGRAELFDVGEIDRHLDLAAGGGRAWPPADRR